MNPNGWDTSFRPKNGQDNRPCRELSACPLSLEVILCPLTKIRGFFVALDSLQLLTKLEELNKYSHKTVLLFPKAERHVLAEDIRKTLATLIRLTITAAKRYYKKTTLQDMDVELEVLRVQIRLAWNLEYINAHKYEVWSEHVSEVGRMLGGWLKNVRDSKQGEQK